MFRAEDFAELTTIIASRYRARAPRPSAPNEEASLHFIDVAATLLAEEENLLFSNWLTTKLDVGRL